MAEEATTVSCAVCGHEVTVSLRAAGYQEDLERELPVGWTLTWERDEETGEYARVLRCPEHRPLPAQEPT